jgi:CoA:oxalate CoA-transferase
MFSTGELVAAVDVMVENFAPGVIARHGLGYETVRALNPRLVMRSISLCGQAGPSSYKPGFDHIGASLAGVLDMTGEADGPPLLNTMGIGDISTGVHGLSAVLAALLHRERTGKGQWVDVSLVDTCHRAAGDSRARHPADRTCLGLLRSAPAPS